MIEWFRGHVERLQIEANVLRFWHRVILATCAIALVLQVIGCGITAYRHMLGSRYAATILGFVLTALSLAINQFALVSEPHMLVMFALQLVALLALLVTAVSAGSVAVLVDLCNWNEANAVFSCGANWLEYVAAWLTMICLCLIFAGTQKKIIMLVDRGILNGIGTRMSSLG